MKTYLLVLIALLLVSCGTLDISDERVDEIVSAAKSGAEIGAKVLSVPVDSITPGASAGISAMGGIAVAALVRWILKGLQAKKQQEIEEVVKKVQS